MRPTARTLRCLGPMAREIPTIGDRLGPARSRSDARARIVLPDAGPYGEKARQPSTETRTPRILQWPPHFRQKPRQSWEPKSLHKP
jgi:hypothetical protein